MESSQTYGLDQWREDLKRLLLGAGLDGKHTAFLFTDSQLRHEAFLEDINSLLNTGEVSFYYRALHVRRESAGVVPNPHGSDSQQNKINCAALTRNNKTHDA